MQTDTSTIFYLQPLYNQLSTITVYYLDNIDPSTSPFGMSQLDLVITSQSTEISINSAASRNGSDIRRLANLCLILGVTTALDDTLV